LARGRVITNITAISFNFVVIAVDNTRLTSLSVVVKEATMLAGHVMSFTFSTLISVFTFNTNI